MNMAFTQFIVISIMVAIAAAQRSPYAGRRPIGYPVIETTSLTNDALGNRLGENDNATASNVTTTTQRLPIEALGDRELVNRLGKLPEDKQPFWFLNWQALEAQRKQPQTYNQRPSVFVESPFFFPQDDQNNQNFQNPGQNPSNPNFSQQSQSFQNPGQQSQNFQNPGQQSQNFQNPGQDFQNPQNNRFPQNMGRMFF